MAQFDEKPFFFYEGSEQLVKTSKNTLDDFKKLSPLHQNLVRASAIETISRECAKARKAGIVTGHFSFCHAPTSTSISTIPGGPSTAPVHEVVMIDADKRAYAHILYLRPSPETVVKQVAKDSSRQRPQFDIETVREWQEIEEKQLRSICRDHDIVFTTIEPEVLNQTTLIAEILRDAASHNEKTNGALVDNTLDGILHRRMMNDVKTMLVLDADNTLAPYDASTLCWQLSSSETNPLKDLFKSPLGYFYTAFRQMTKLYEQDAELGGNFDQNCEEAASRIKVHPEMLELLQKACADKTVGVVIVTCGLKPIWEKVIARLSLNNAVPIIGNGLLSNGYIVTPKTKADIVTRLKHHHKLQVCAIGDSEVDLQMLKKAHQALVVMGHQSSRCKSFESFDAKLRKAIDNEGLRACQVLLPPGSKPRLDIKILPTVELNEAFTALITKNHSLKIYNASANNTPAAKLLASSTRNVNVHGLELQQAHENAGWYLATEYISLALGVESFDFTTVEGKPAQGHRLVDESKTLIIPLMRGGDPIARGVVKAFPTTMYHHAKKPEEVKPEHMAGKNTIILADWVVNTGKGMVEFVKHIRENLSFQIRIVMVTGVVQEEVVGKDGMQGVFARELAGLGDVTLVTLRVSKNKYTGTRGTDTGHRLFNSTHLT